MKKQHTHTHVERQTTNKHHNKLYATQLQARPLTRIAVVSCNHDHDHDHDHDVIVVDDDDGTAHDVLLLTPTLTPMLIQMHPACE